MPNPKPPIEPKPTQYGNILFRSRLEARWAVFLDFTENVLNWEYEPKTFQLRNGWLYTPDFRLKLAPLCQPPKGHILDEIYMEVKPKRITDQYRDMISRVAAQFKVPIFVVMGDFYNEVTWSHLHLPGRRHTLPTVIHEIFANVGRGRYHAEHFRFDLKE